MKPRVVHIGRQGTQVCPHCGYMANTQCSAAGRVVLAPGKIFICGGCLKPSLTVQNGLLLSLQPMQDADLAAGPLDTLQRIRAEMARMKPDSSDPDQIQSALLVAIERASRRFPTRPGGAPVYWKDETSGVMSAIVKKYLGCVPLSEDEFELLRQYFEQWYCAPAWNTSDGEIGKLLDNIRREVALADSEPRLRMLESAALAIGINPL